MQAAGIRLIGRLGGFERTRVIASPLSRAAESARLITGGIQPILIDDLRELDFGIFEGLTEEEIQSRHPDEYARWMRARHSPDYTFPGGDNRGAFAARVARGLEHVLSEWDMETCANTLVVAHRGVVRSIVRLLTPAEPEAELASIQILVRDGGWQVALLDDISHLDQL